MKNLEVKITRYDDNNIGEKIKDVKFDCNSVKNFFNADYLFPIKKVDNFDFKKTRAKLTVNFEGKLYSVYTALETMPYKKSTNNRIEIKATLFNDSKIEEETKVFIVDCDFLEKNFKATGILGKVNNFDIEYLRADIIANSENITVIEVNCKEGL